MRFFFPIALLAMGIAFPIVRSMFDRRAFGAELAQFQSASARKKALRKARFAAARSLQSFLSTLAFLAVYICWCVLIQQDDIVWTIGLVLILATSTMFSLIVQKRGIQRSLWRQLAKQGVLCCRECGYNLTGNISGVCPECGTRTSRFGGNA